MDEKNNVAAQAEAQKARQAALEQEISDLLRAKIELKAALNLHASKIKELQAQVPPVAQPQPEAQKNEA